MSDAEAMSPERFAELAEAYGGAVARWPEAVREPALRLAAEPRFAALLVEAERLDARLDEWLVAPPSDALVDVVRAGVPVRRMPRPSRVRLWWSSIGLATALAGVVTGAVAVVMIDSGDRVPVENSTAFGDVAGQDL